MKNVYTLLVLIFGGFLTGFAQGNDPAAKAVLNAVSAKFKTFKAVQSNFTLQVEDGNGKCRVPKKAPYG